MSSLVFSSRTNIDSTILYCCDGKCSKAWGISSRPTKQLSIVVDDIFFIGDVELQIDADYPISFENGYGRLSEGYADVAGHNAWCIRQCERIESTVVIDLVKKSADRLRLLMYTKINELKRGWYNIPTLDSNKSIDSINEL